jgi:Fe-S cluster biogenesis protein NfuA
MQEKIEALLNTIIPFLRVQGRDAKLVEATPERISIQLSGFCGDCGCSSEYVDGLKQMIVEQFPEVKDVEILKA